MPLCRRGGAGDHRAVRDLDLRPSPVVAVCDCRTMARAAAQERIEPSAVSKRIAQLETTSASSCWCARGAASSDAGGLALLERARDVVSRIDRSNADAASFAAGVVTATFACSRPPAAIAEGLLGDVAAVHARAGPRRNPVVDLEERERAAISSAPSTSGHASSRRLRRPQGTLRPARGPWRGALVRRDPARAGGVMPATALAGRLRFRFAEGRSASITIGMPPTDAGCMPLLQREDGCGSTAPCRYRTVVVRTFDAALRGRRRRPSGRRPVPLRGRPSGAHRRRPDL
jgi:hypothetical protein